MKVVPVNKAVAIGRSKSVVISIECTANIIVLVANIMMEVEFEGNRSKECFERNGFGLIFDVTVSKCERIVYYVPCIFTPKLFSVEKCVAIEEKRSKRK